MAEAGLLSSVRRLLSTLASVAVTRLELLANELHEERLHVEQMLLYFFATLFCFGMTIMLLTVFIVVLCWDDHRLSVLAGLGALFLVIGIMLTRRLQQIAQVKSKLFSASLAELARDREQLDGRDE